MRRQRGKYQRFNYSYGCIFRNYQKNLEEAAQKRIEGLSLEEKIEEVIVEKDQIFGDEPVPKRYYDRVLQKELYFHHRSN